jgi:hypothetical protein
MSTLARPRLVSPASAPRVAGPRTTTARPLALGLIVIALGLAAVRCSATRVGSGGYRVTQTLRNQVIGWTPSRCSSWRPGTGCRGTRLRQRLLGPVLALGIGAYTSYMFIQHNLGPDYGHRAGTNQRLFPLCLVLSRPADWSHSPAGTRSIARRWSAHGLRIHPAIPERRATPINWDLRPSSRFRSSLSLSVRHKGGRHGNAG